MLELKGDYYYNSIVIKNLETGEVLNGEIFVNNDGWCEGIITSDITDNSKDNLIIGIFNKYKNFELYELTSNKVYKYAASKGYLQYDGIFEVDDENIKGIPFYLKCSQLRCDPRESYYSNECVFLQNLSLFKLIIFKDENIKAKYEYILSIKDKIKERLSDSNVKKR